MVWDLVRDFSHFVWLWVRIPKWLGNESQPAGGPQEQCFYCETRFIAKAICLYCSLPDLSFVCSDFWCIMKRGMRLVVWESRLFMSGPLKRLLRFANLGSSTQLGDNGFPKPTGD